MTDESIQPVLSHYGLSGSQVQIEPLANAGGWSGSLLWRITDATGHQFCLRRWPSDRPSPEQRVQFIHNVLLHVAPGLPIISFPLRTTSQETFLRHAGHFWELTKWLPGVADFHANPSLDRLRAAIHTLARFHTLAVSFANLTAPAPAIAERTEQLAWLSSHSLTNIERSLATPLQNEIDPAATRLFSALQHRLSRPIPVCPINPNTRLPLQPAIRDIHHDHVLFTGDEVTGLIDFGAMRIDTPLTDIARLVGSLVGDNTPARRAAFNVYAEFRPLAEGDERLIDWLDGTALVIAAHNWLRWLYIERRDMGPTAPIVQRIEEINRRLAIE